MARVLCIGIAVLDYVYALDELPRGPEKFRANSMKAVGGGTAANAAVAVTRLGGEAVLAARLGEDGTATEIVSGLETERVSCALVRMFPNVRSPLSAVILDAKGERIAVSHIDPAMPVSAEWLPASIPKGVDVVLGDTRWEEGAAHMFRLAQKIGATTVFDADRAPKNPDTLSLATHVAFGAQGLRELTGIQDPVAGLKAVRPQVPGWLAVTIGAEGVLYCEGERVLHAPGFKVATVDTLAAGDVWHGAFALALAEGWPEREAVHFASAVAALKCTRFGGREGIPTRADVDNFLKEQARAAAKAEGKAAAKPAGRKAA